MDSTRTAGVDHLGRLPTLADMGAETLRVEHSVDLLLPLGQFRKRVLALSAEIVGMFQNVRHITKVGVR
jgi:hypothetical protein